jgi:hypothetical protein
VKRTEEAGDDEHRQMDHYKEVRPLLRQVRVMNRFFDEVIEEPPYRERYFDLYEAYVKILNEELGPHAAELALALAEVEDAYPEIGRDAE